MSYRSTTCYRNHVTILVQQITCHPRCLTLTRLRNLRWNGWARWSQMTRTCLKLMILTGPGRLVSVTMCHCVTHIVPESLTQSLVRTWWWIEQSIQSIVIQWWVRGVVSRHTHSHTLTDSQSHCLSQSQATNSTHSHLSLLSAGREAKEARTNRRKKRTSPQSNS